MNYGNWNEIRAGLPKKGLRGVGIHYNRLTDRLNGLATAFEAKEKLGLDYNVPLIIMPYNEDYCEYAYEQRVIDVLEALTRKTDTPAYKLVSGNNFKLVHQVFENYLPQILVLNPNFKTKIIEKIRDTRIISDRILIFYYVRITQARDLNEVDKLRKQVSEILPENENIKKRLKIK